MHSMIEAHAEGDDPFEKLDDIDLKDGKLFRSEREMYGDIIEDIRCIMSEYFEYWKRDRMYYVGVKGKRAEHEFEVPITNRIILTGKIDCIVKRDGLRLIGEHKTFNHQPSTDDQWRNLQSCSYTRVIDMLGWPQVDGMLWDYIHSKPPTWPKMLKNGTFGRKAINTLPSRVRQALEKEGLSEKKYTTLISMAEGNRSNYFKRVITPTKPQVVDEVFTDLVNTAKEMESRHGECRERNIDRHCAYCDYEPICRAALQGSDVDYVKKKEYTKNDKKDG